MGSTTLFLLPVLLVGVGTVVMILMVHPNELSSRMFTFVHCFCVCTVRFCVFGCQCEWNMEQLPPPIVIRPRPDRPVMVVFHCCVTVLSACSQPRVCIVCAGTLTNRVGDEQSTIMFGVSQYGISSE